MTESRPQGGRAKSAARHLAIYSVGTVSRQLVGFIMLPIYTRLLSPADYGVVALLAVMISVFELVIGARFSKAVPRFYFRTDDANERKTVVSTSLIATACISAIGVAVVAGSSEALSSFLFGTAEYATYVAIYASLLLTIAVENYGLTYLRLTDRPIAFVTVSLLKLFAQLSLNIWFVVVLELGVAGVVYAAVISSAVFAAGSALFVHASVGVKFSRRVATEFVRFSWPLWIAGGAALYISSMGPYLVRVLDGLAAVGLYQIAYRFSSLITVLGWKPFSQWWQVERFQVHAEEGLTSDMYGKVFDLVVALLCSAAVGVAVFGAPVIRIMAAPDFHSSVYALPFLAMAQVFGFTARFMNFSFMITDRTLNITVLRILSAAVVTVAFIVGVQSASYVGAAMALCLTNAFMVVVSYLRSRQVADIGLSLAYPLVFVVLAAATIALDYAIAEPLELLPQLATKAAMYGAYTICVVAIVHYNPKTRFATALLRNYLARRSSKPDG